MPSGAPSAGRATDPVGLAAALGSATGLGLAVPCAKLAILAGGNAVTLASVRTLFFAALFVLLALALRRTLQLPRARRLDALGLGVLLGISFYANIGAVEFISVGLTALIFYTYPILVALISIALGERLSAGKLIALLLCFGGLGLMLLPAMGDVDWRGVALSGAASFSAGVHAVWQSRRTTGTDMLVLTAWQALVALLILGLMLALTGPVAFPEGSVGWTGFWAVVVLQSLGIPVYFVALARLGPVRSVTIMNLQPVVSIVAAFLMFGEVLGPLQYVGGALVLGGVLLVQRDRGREGARAR